MVISKGGVGPIDFWTSSGPWVDEAGLFYATRAAMANSGLRITFMFVDPLSPPMVFKPFTPKGPVAKSQGVSTAGEVCFVDGRDVAKIS